MDLATYIERLNALPTEPGPETDRAVETLRQDIFRAFGLTLDNWRLVMVDWKEAVHFVEEMHLAERAGFNYLMPVEQLTLPSGQGDDLLAICSKVPLEPDQATILADLYYNLGLFEGV